MAFNLLYLFRSINPPVLFCSFKRSDCFSKMKCKQFTGEFIINTITNTAEMFPLLLSIDPQLFAAQIPQDAGNFSSTASRHFYRFVRRML